MKIKRALVVDDSKVARSMLADILEKQGVAVDTTENAEDALEYLLDHRPDVIFLDHVMPGMDGFQAMRAIKQNPDTATIPIMMYTTQEGELYVSQARALGAAGCLPKQVQPVDVAKVLESLSQTPVTHGSPANDDRHADEDVAPVIEIEDLDTGGSLRERMLETVELAEADALQSAMKRLLDGQRAGLRRDIAEECERATRLVMDELGYSGDGAPRRRMSTLRRLALAGVFIVLPAVVLFKLYLNAETERDQLEQRYNRLLTHQQGLQASVERTSQTQDVLGEKYRLLQADFTDQQVQAQRERQQLLNALAWAVGERSMLDYDQHPLDEAQLDAMRGLLAQLTDLGFSGQIRITRHHGRFCLQNSGGMSFIRPDDATPFGDCVIVDNPTAWETTDARALEQLLNNELVNRGSRIRFQVVDMGADKPRNLYPSPTAVRSAGEWNRVAMRNNRLEFEFVPDPVLSASESAAGGTQ